MAKLITLFDQLEKIVGFFDQNQTTPSFKTWATNSLLTNNNFIFFRSKLKNCCNLGFQKPIQLFSLKKNFAVIKQNGKIS